MYKNVVMDENQVRKMAAEIAKEFSNLLQMCSYGG